MALVYLTVCWVAGIALVKAIALPWQVTAVILLFGFIVALLWREEHKVRLGALCAVALALGAIRMQLALPRFDDSSLAAFNDVGAVTLKGVVVAEPDERDSYTNLRVRAESLLLPGGEEVDVEGLALVRASRYPRRSYGDRVLVEGRLETPPVFEGFSYKDYLARQGVYSLFDRAGVRLVAENQANPLLYRLFQFKRRAQSAIAAILPEPQAALLTGILLGVETGIPPQTLEAFNATGTTHIIAISGFNITIVAGLFSGLARRMVGERKAVWVATAGVLVYTLLVGGSAPVVRAAIMGLLYIWAQYLGRESFAPVSLAAAALLMTAVNPHVLWDVGFQLSIGATIGLVVYTAPLERGLERLLARLLSPARARRIVALVSEALIVTLAAQITTTPVILHYFGRLSLVTLLTNFLILPAQAGLMIAGGVATLLAMLFRPLGQIAGWVAWVFLTYTIEVVQLTARIPLASVPAQAAEWMVWAYYLLLGGLTWWFAQPGERRRELWARMWIALRGRVSPPVRVGAAAMVLLLGFAAWRGLPDGRLHVVFLDVGQGDAIFIQTPSGHQALIDGGPSEAALLSQLGRQVPFWDRTLDLMVLTHQDLDHVTGLIPALERYKVGMVVYRDQEVESAAYRRWLELAGQEGADLIAGRAGVRLTLDDGVDLVLLHPGEELVSWTEADVNNNSIVGRLTYGSVSLLLTGDIEAEVEESLARASLEAPLRSTVLKAAHHGACTSTTSEFLVAVDPALAVISVGAENTFGHPCEEVLERLEGLPLYRTDQHGAVEVISDGTKLWVEVERE
jgi:competence protein ComEC